MKLLACLWLVFAGLSAPQDSDAPKAQAAMYARATGQDVRVAIEIQIADGWHLYHGPTREDLGPPEAVGKQTTVTFEGASIEWSPVRFPTPHRAEQDFGDGPTYIFQHDGTIVLYAGGKKTGEREDLTALRALIAGETCNDGAGVCIGYRETVANQGLGPDALFKAFPADLAIGEATPPASAATPPDAGADRNAARATTSASPGAPPAKSPAATDPPPVELGLFAFLLSAIGWGIFTLLMPCTYPMIPITISYFTKQAAQRETSVLPLALCYGAGIVLIFVVIGIAVGPLIIPFATHPVTNLVIGGFFLLFALALFGVVDLQPPAFLTNAAGQASMRGGYAGVFLMGLTLVVTSFTCTAPFVGTLLSTGASSGSLGRVALGMAVFGATMAIPFVLLSLLPDRVKSLPRSGEWMHVLKVTLGFVEIAAALKFLSNVDLVWGWGWLSRELFLFLWFGVFIAAALYLFGLIRLKDEATHEISPGRLVTALGFFLFAIYCGFGALGNSMDPILTALAPPYSNRAQTTIGQADPAARPKVHAIVKDDYAAALEQARREGKGLLVNFTGFT